MNSKSNNNAGSSSKSNASLGSGISGSDQDQSPLRCGTKPTTNDLEKTRNSISGSVRQSIHGEPSTSRGQTFNDTPSTLRGLSEEEAVLAIIDSFSTPSFDAMQDLNGTVDLSDLELQSNEPAIQHLNSCGLVRKSQGKNDLTLVEDFPVDCVNSVGYPYLRSSKGTTNFPDPNTSILNDGSLLTDIDVGNSSDEPLPDSVSRELASAGLHELETVAPSFDPRNESVASLITFSGVCDDHHHPSLQPTKDIPVSEVCNHNASEVLVKIVNCSGSSSSGTVPVEEWRNLPCVSCEQSGSFSVLEDALSDSDNESHPNGLLGNDDAQLLARTRGHSFVDAATSNEDSEVNFVLRTPEYDLVYAPEQQEEQNECLILPDTELPRNSSTSTTSNQEVPDLKYILQSGNLKFEQDGSNNDLNTVPCTPPLIQIYLAYNVPGRSTSTEPEAVTNEEQDAPINASSASDAGNEGLHDTVQRSGSAGLLANLPGLDTQNGQFDKPRSLPPAQDQLEVEEEMVKLATRSKREVPPMEFGLYHWQSIVEVLTMNEPDTVKQILCHLCKMTTKRFCDLIKFYQCGLLDNLLALREHNPDDRLIQNLSLKLIAELSVVPDCCEDLLDCKDLLLQCITFLKEEDTSAHFQECASKILKAVAKDKSLQMSLLHKHDMIEVLLGKILKTSDPDIRCNCMEILLRIVNNEMACKRFMNSEQFNVPMFCTLLESKYAKIQQLTLGLLVVITKYETEESFQEKFHASGLSQIMVNILETDTMVDFSHLVISILSNIANTEYGLHFLRNAGVIKFLIDYIHNAGKEDLLGCGLDIIVKLSVSKIGRSYLVEFDVPVRLVKYLKLNEGTTLERSCVAIANLSEHPGALREMVAENPADDLIRLIYEENSSQIKFAASRALFELAARDQIMCQLMAELHVTEVFHYIISSGFADVETLRSISEIIQVISHYPMLKHYMINEESMACFLDIIQGFSRKTEVSDDHLENEEALRVAAMQCLRCYLSEPECRALFSYASGVFVVRSTLQSPSIVIKQATALLIELVGKDPALAREMVVAGIIPIMLSDLAMQAACPAWRKALEQIFNSHLPSKFAYCNRLDITDLTSEGFYIASTRTREIQVLDTLLTDRKCPVDNIYVCNFTTKHQSPDLFAPVITRPKWEPWHKTEFPYSPTVAALEDRDVASFWRRRASLLYGSSSLESCSTSSLEFSLSDSSSSSLMFGKRGISNCTSSVDRQVEDSIPSLKESILKSVNSNDNLPEAEDGKKDDLNANLEEFGVCPLDPELHRYFESLMTVVLEDLNNDDGSVADTRYPTATDTRLIRFAEILARFVCRQMSGNSEKMPNLVTVFDAWLWELKERFQSSILPLGQIKAGLHLERAMLFKVLADKVGLPCTFVRGEYGIAYNEICLPCPNNEFPIPPTAMSPNYVVDLMQNIGTLYFIESPEARDYCNITN